MQVTHYINNKTGIYEPIADSTHSENTLPPTLENFNAVRTHDVNEICDYCKAKTIMAIAPQPGQVIEYDEPIQAQPDPAKPSYYNKGGIEPVDYMQMKMTGEQYQGFCLGNVIKYVSRYRDKNGLEDLQKAQWYLNEMIRTYKNPSS